MIEKFEDLELHDIKTIEEAEAKINDKLGISVLEMKQALSNYVQYNAEELIKGTINIVPFGDYGELIDDLHKMEEFLKEEAHKVEHWRLKSAKIASNKEDLLVFEFLNKSVDDGDCFRGHVFVSLQGKIKHVFAQNDQ